MVYQCLSELGLPSGKNETMEKEAFTFDKFYALYHKICPRNDIEELFRSMLVNLFLKFKFKFKHSSIAAFSALSFLCIRLVRKLRK